MKSTLPFFLKNFTLVFALAISLNSCKNNTESNNSDTAEVVDSTTAKPFFKLSLAQWSLHKPIMDGTMDPVDFAQKANEMGFEGIEYVSQLYTPKLENGSSKEEALKNLLDTLKMKSEQYHVRNVLIMVDNEGDLAISDEKKRNEAVENHKKWVDAAQFLGCHSIRVNLFGSEDAEEWKKNSVDGLKKLSEYASTKNINVLVENHGYFSSNAAMLTDVIKQVGLDNAGTLPDFGNFCLKRENNARWDAPCIEEYPRYQGVEEMMPMAKAVSAKSYEFDEDGQETLIDYGKMLKIIKDAGYTSFIGVEFEGEEMTSEEGIKATKELLLTEAAKL